MLVQYIDKNGNINHFDNQKEFGRLEQMEKIGNIYFEKKEVKEVVESIDFKKLLKDNGIKSTHLLSDKKAEEKCIELGLL